MLCLFTGPIPPVTFTVLSHIQVPISKDAVVADADGLFVCVLFVGGVGGGGLWFLFLLQLTIVSSKKRLMIFFIFRRFLCTHTPEVSL